MEMKPKIALIGTGNWGKKLLKELSDLAEVKSVITKGNPDTISFIKENFPFIKISSDINDVLNDNEISSVFVATPTDTHHEIALKILFAKKHLFLEKPGGKNSKELNEIANIAKEKNLTLALGYEFIHHPVLQKIIDKVGNKKIEYVNMEWFKWGTFRDAIPAHLLSHEISIIKHLTQINPVISDFKQYGTISVSDISHCNMKSGQVIINSIINRVSPEKRKTVTVKCDSTSYIWNNNDLFTIENEKLKKIDTNSDSPVKLEILDFFEAIEKRAEPKANGSFASEVFQTIEGL